MKGRRRIQAWRDHYFWLAFPSAAASAFAVAWELEFPIWYGAVTVLTGAVLGGFAGAFVARLLNR